MPGNSEYMRVSFYDFFFLILIVALADAFIGQIVTGYFIQSWGISEFLINYQGGFVRRGLIGEIVYKLHLVGFLSFNPYYTILFLSLCSIFVLLFVLFYIFKKANIGYFILPTTILFGFVIIEDSWLRKDSIILLLSFISIKLLIRNKISYNLFYSLVASIAILIHEAAFFIIIPISIFILVFNKKYLTYNYASLIISLSIIVVTLFFSLQYSGINSDTERIWDSWNQLNLPVMYNTAAVDATAINALKWTPKFSIQYTWDYNLSFKYDVYPIFVWSLLLFFILLLISNIKYSPKILTQQLMPNIDANFSALIYFVTFAQLIAIFPLFILGIDYGRWIFLWTTSSLLYTSILRDVISIEMLPSILVKSEIYFRKLSDYIFNNNANVYVLVTILIGYPGYSFVLDNFISSGSLFFIFSFVSRTVRHVLYLI